MSKGNQQRLSGEIQTHSKIQFRPVQRPGAADRRRRAGGYIFLRRLAADGHARQERPAGTGHAKKPALESTGDHRAGGFQARHFFAEGFIEGRRQKNRSRRAVLRAGRRLQQQVSERRRLVGPGQAEGGSGTRCPRDSGFGRVRQRRSRVRLQNRRRRFQESEDRLRSAHRQRTQDHLPGCNRQRVEAQRRGARFHELRPEPAPQRTLSKNMALSY